MCLNPEGDKILNDLAMRGVLASHLYSITSGDERQDSSAGASKLIERINAQ
ncbi:MAG: hypothetical protein ICV79_22520 [Flavisolibacter sp.]|nr:hypothetical protein [Flavisolibacter sp.]